MTRHPASSEMRKAVSTQGRDQQLAILTHAVLLISCEQLGALLTLGSSNSEGREMEKHHPKPEASLDRPVRTCHISFLFSGEAQGLRASASHHTITHRV